MRHGDALWLILVLATASAQADPVVEYRVHADLIAMPVAESRKARCSVRMPQTGDVVTLTWTSDRARMDRPDKSVILRADEKKLCFLFHETRTYACIPYPVAGKKYTTSFEKDMGEELLRYEAESLGGPENTEVLGRAGVRYHGVFVNGARRQWRSSVVVAVEAPASPSMAAALRTALHDLRFGGRGWLAFMPLGQRLPLIWEEAQRQPESEAVYREEATEIGERSVPEGTYAVPADYAKVDFDPQCMRRW